MDRQIRRLEDQYNRQIVVAGLAPAKQNTKRKGRHMCDPFFFYCSNRNDLLPYKEQKIFN